MRSQVQALYFPPPSSHRRLTRNIAKFNLCVALWEVFLEGFCVALAVGVVAVGVWLIIAAVVLNGPVASSGLVEFAGEVGGPSQFSTSVFYGILFSL